MNREDVIITAKDMRQGMGIGAWWMRYTATHKPTNCLVQWETRGGNPESQYKMRERALMALELLVEVYPST